MDHVNLEMIKTIPEAFSDQSFGVVPVFRDINRKTTKFLLIQHRTGKHWAFPKGHADPEESGIQAALRELTEETGIQGVTLDAGACFEESYPRPNGKGLKGVRYWVGFVSNPKVKIQAKEVLAFRWVSARQAKLLITFDTSRTMLDKVLIYLKGEG
jgi:8-oxo-dGTP pyrophosphatase MutT (NUDIX family)